LTPKGLNGTIDRAESKNRQVQSTKAADGSKMFTNSGRYGKSNIINADLKQLFEVRNQSELSK
jgi:hypothetical protein